MTSRDLIRGENSAKPGSVIPISPDKEMGGVFKIRDMESSLH
jgi:hypothetical protein